MDELAVPASLSSQQQQQQQPISSEFDPVIIPGSDFEPILLPAPIPTSDFETSESSTNDNLKSEWIPEDPLVGKLSVKSDEDDEEGDESDDQICVTPTSHNLLSTQGERRKRDTLTK